MQGLGGKERRAAGGGCRRMEYRGGQQLVGRGRGGGKGEGERVALTYLCRVLHATPILGVVGTNPLCAYHAGWFEIARYADLVRTFTGAVIYSPGNANQFGW